jgi:3-oxoacyl-[acyl-carrier-protein] synthase-3
VRLERKTEQRNPTIAQRPEMILELADYATLLELVDLDHARQQLERVARVAGELLKRGDILREAAAAVADAGAQEALADALIKTGSARCALVVGAEIFSRILDFKDRGTCVLFGDGAGAVVLEASETPGILSTDLHADGRHVDILCVPGHVQGGAVSGVPLLKMAGQAVFKLAVGVLEDAARAVLSKAGKTETDIDWLVPHQANIRIIQSTAKKLKLPMEKVLLTVAEHGNTSAASIPLALDKGVRAGLVKPGQLVMLEGVGGGFAWGSVLLRY